MMDKDSAVLQGAFLLADKLCLPSSLCSLEKADWSRVGRPVLEAVREICGQDKLSGHLHSVAGCWRKKIVCVVWLKLLCRQAEEDVETSWRENPFFPLQSGLPEVNHVVLLELVRSMEAADVFANFLLCLPQSQICVELERLIQYVKSSPTKEEDVRLFLDVWWELWKGRSEQKGGGGEESIEAMFANQFARLSSKSSSVSPQAAKRLRLDTSDQLASSPSTDVLHILLHALKDMKDHISSTDLCLQALSISLDSLYTTLLIDKEVSLPTKQKMHMLSKAVSIKEKNYERLSPELIQEAQRDLRASHKPSQFQPTKLKLGEALKMITDLTQFWLNSGLLRAYDSANLSYSAFKLEQSVQRVLPETDVQETEKNILRDLLKSLAFPDTQTTPEVDAKVTMIIISHRLEDYQNFAVLFASERSWASCDEHWLDCLEKNQAAFRQHITLLDLASTLMTKLHSGSSDVSQCRKLMKVTADIFSALSLEDKNKSLAAMLRLSPRGFFGHPVPSSVTDGFEQELNMAFNCIIQGGGGATAAVSQGNLNTAASLVARVAFQNPEAALRSCCHSAVFNKGAFSLMAQILQLLPGLRRQKGRKDEAERHEKERKEAKENIDEGKDAWSGSSLLCRCLQDMIKNKSLLASEKEQLLKFLGLLMMPVIEVEGEERKQCFLPPQEVVNIFVLPNLSTTTHSSCDIELSVQLLHTALCVDVQDPASSSHWVLDCSPFPLLYVLAQLHNQALRFWEQPPEGAVHHWSMDTMELLVLVLATLGEVMGAEVAAAPSSWSRALFWLYNKMEELDWTVRFHLKPVWGEHFKNEVPSSLLAVCDLPEQDWSGLDLPQYGQGSGLLAWMECCSISDSLKSTMLSCLSLDQRRPDHVGMFSKGLLVALTQTLPWCSVSQWSRLLGVLRELITSGRLHVPFSLEYVDYLPLLDLRRFSCELRLSVLLLRVLQLLCGSSCSHWLSAPHGWAHIGRLYAHAVREMMSSVRAKLPLPSSGAWTVSASTPPKAPTSRDSNPPCSSDKASNMSRDAETSAVKSEESQMEKEVETAPSQEVLFVLSQLFCHVQHIQVMMPRGQCEPLFLSSLEILSHYEAIMAAFPESSSPLESDNTRHFFTTITDNLENQEMKVVLQQKIAQLVSADAR
ncbi:gem-associated protein 4 [Seriola aureovittata]|uniref:gem-associated protein 4 n=1 Tax=Seriola aureovittata TaxID=2871759 RepID=UPI0024BD7DDC|nr:gem-associated protein 4 [Seriola aureovittata]XP_056229958.1 gem-associated protein 4 [Seriola aureovittata]